MLVKKLRELGCVSLVQVALDEWICENCSHPSPTSNSKLNMSVIYSIWWKELQYVNMSTNLWQDDCKAVIAGCYIVVAKSFLGAISSLWWLLKSVAWCSVSILVPQSTGIISEVRHLEAVNNISNVVLTCLWDASRPCINRLDMWKIRAQKRASCELWARRFDIISSGHQHTGNTISGSHNAAAFGRRRLKGSLHQTWNYLS